VPVIEVMGLASGTSKSIPFSQEEQNENLLTWLRKKGITIASSCDGEGVCKKCNIQNDWLTCKLTLKELIERRPDGKIMVSYL
jgi:ferredoxin